MMVPNGKMPLRRSRVYETIISSPRIDFGLRSVLLFRRGNVSAWVDLLILIPSWLGVFGIIAGMLASVIS